MNNEKLSIIALLTAVATVVGIITGGLAIFEKFEQSEAELSRLNNELELMAVQFEDKKHENIITRIKNADLVLSICDELSFSETNSIRQMLFESSKSAMLIQDFEKAEEMLEGVMDDLMVCGTGSIVTQTAPDAWSRSTEGSLSSEIDADEESAETIERFIGEKTP